jgi:uncharacterized protein
MEVWAGTRLGDPGSVPASAFAAPPAAGFLVGGWIGPKITRKVPAGPFRVIVSLGGIGLAVSLGMSAYR